MRPTSPVIAFSDDRRELQEALGKDPDGTASTSEILRAVRSMQQQKKASDEAAHAGGIPIASFSVKHQDKLNSLDTNGNGILEAGEVLTGVEALIRERERSTKLMRLSMGEPLHASPASL
jgi:uncharacterized protein YcaQ